MRPVPLAALIAAILLAAAPGAGAQTLERIRESGEIRLGYRTDAAPLSFADPAGQPAGFTPMVCRAVAELIAGEHGIEDLAATWTAVEAEDRFERVASGEIDLLCGAATITLERRATVDFSIPTFVDGAAVLLPAGAEPDLEALAGKRAGVRAGTTTETILTNSLAAMGQDTEIVPFDGHDAGLAALEAGEIDAYFGDQSILFGLYFASDASENLVISDNTLTVEKHGLAMTRGDTEFRLAVDRALSALYAQGRMREFFAQAFPGASPGVALEALYLIAPELP